MCRRVSFPVTLRCEHLDREGVSFPETLRCEHLDREGYDEKMEMEGKLRLKSGDHLPGTKNMPWVKVLSVCVCAHACACVCVQS